MEKWSEGMVLRILEKSKKRIEQNKKFGLDKEKKIFETQRKFFFFKIIF